MKARAVKQYPDTDTANIDIYAWTYKMLDEKMNRDRWCA